MVQLTSTNMLASQRPKLATQWDQTQNGDLTLDHISSGSHLKVWWKCPTGPDHRWQATIDNRVRKNQGCPFCAGRRTSVTNSLASLRPDLAAHWHHTKNGHFTPYLVVAGSNAKVWWKCPRGADHEWQATVHSRTGRGAGCPFCRGLKVSVTNSLPSLFPTIARQWHPTKNGELAPEQFVAGSLKKVWWKCSNGPDHDWNARVVERTRLAHGCPFCAGQRVSVTNSLATLHPDLAKQWHPTKNLTIKPNEVIAGSHRKVWWKCPAGPDHEWEAPVVARTRPGTKTRHGAGCPSCTGKSLSVTNSLATRFPEIATQWHPSRNAPLTPDRVIAGSRRPFWWRCQNAPDHEWRASLDNRTRGRTSCPFCTLTHTSTEQVALAFELSLFFDFNVTEHKLSLNGRVFDVDIMIPEVHTIVEFDGNYWHRSKEREDRNKTDYLRAHGWRVIRVRQEPLEPISSDDVVVPKELNLKDVADRVLLKLQRVCQINLPNLQTYLGRKTLANEKACKTFVTQLLRKDLVPNSLALRFPYVASQWHPSKNGILTPHQIAAGSHFKFWWECPQNPDHVWQASVANRTRLGQGCPFCARQRSQNR